MAINTSQTAESSGCNDVCFLTCITFDNRNGAGIRTQHELETEIDFTKTYAGKGDKPAAWKDVSLKDPTAVLNFQSHLGRSDWATAYAATTIHSAVDKTVYLRSSGEDMFEVIVDGKKVLQRLMQQKLLYDDDMVAIALKKGENTILVKVHNQYGPWRLRARLTESSNPTATAAVLTAPTKVAARNR